MCKVVTNPTIIQQTSTCNLSMQVKKNEEKNITFILAFDITIYIRLENHVVYKIFPNFHVNSDFMQSLKDKIKALVRRYVISIKSWEIWPQNFPFLLATQHG